MNKIGLNIKYLRNLNNLSQQELADIIGCTRDNIASYERGTEPKIALLLSIGNYFHISIDALLQHDLSSETSSHNLLSEPVPVYEQNSYSNRPDLIYLTPQIITVDKEGTENITYVPVKAAAGYLNGYKDPEFVEKLPSFSLPGLQEKTYRAFEVDGDSMYPTLENKEMVIGQWVEKLDYIREDRVHILVTKADGVIVKRLLNRIDKYGYIVAKSDAVNDRNLYPNIHVKPDDILEIWYAVWHGGFNFKAPGDLWKRQNNLEADVTELFRRLTQIEQTNKL